MLEEAGTVVELVGAYAHVEVEPRTACGGCSVSGGCGTSVLAKWFGRRRMRLRALNRIGARTGDGVVIGVSEGGLVSASFAAYLVPLLGLISGAIAGQRVGDPGVGELAAIFGAVVGLVTGFVWVAGFTSRHQTDPAYEAVVLRFVTSAPAQIRFLGPADRPRALSRG